MLTIYKQNTMIYLKTKIFLNSKLEKKLSNLRYTSIFALLLFLLSTIGSVAQPLGGEFQVPNPQFESQSYVDIGIDQNGNFVVVWEEYLFSTLDYLVYGQRYNSNGVAQGGRFYIGDGFGYPAIAMRPNGNFTVVWTDESQDEPKDILAQRYDSNANELGSDFQVNVSSGADYEESEPDIAIGVNGNAVVVWERRNFLTDDYDILGQRLDANGNKIGTEFQVNTDMTSFKSNPSVAMDYSGKFVIVHEGTNKVYAQRYNASGTKIGGEFQVNTAPLGSTSYYAPKIAMDSVGNFVVVWNDEGKDGSGLGIYGQRFDPNGNKIGSEFLVNTYTSLDQQNPSIAMDYDGCFVVAWQSEGQDGSGNGIYAQKYDRNGIQLEGEFRVNVSTANSQSWPAVAKNKSCNYVVAWDSYEPLDDITNVFGRRFSNCCPTCNPTADSLALVDLYNATNGGNWVNTWDLVLPMSTWYGVSVDNGGCVEVLNLDGNNLIGTIPSSIGNIAHLRDLRLSANQLSSAIPAEIGNLQQLELLYLYNNQLSGFFPSEIGSLQNLTQIRCYGNQFNGSIPSELGNLQNIIFIMLHNNQFSGTIPSELGNLQNLRELWLLSNQLSGTIPTQLGNLQSLTKLYLSNNQLSGVIPSELGNLQDLSQLWLFSNQLSGAIPVELDNLLNLTNLYLDNNQLSGCFPSSFSQFCSIDYRFSNNPQLPWQGDFSRFCNSENQIGATCDDGNSSTTNDIINAVCQCTGTSSCRQRDSLVLVDLQNSISGTGWNLNDPINTWSGIFLNTDGCVERIALNSGGGSITGSIPTSIGDLSDLVILELYENSLSDTLPKELGQLSKLERMELYNNNFTGSIPLEFSNLSSLEILWLNNNNLSGNIPTTLGGLTPLREMDLSVNNFDGSIPISLENLDQLTYLDLSQNNLSGEIPSELSQLASLNTLYLNDNNLSGCIPGELSTYCNITVEIQNNPALTNDDFATFCSGGTGACLENDDCVDAILLPMNVDPCGIDGREVVLDGAGSTDSPYGDCANTFGSKDVWFKAIVPSTGNFLIRKDSATNIRLYGEAYFGCPNNAMDTISCSYLGEKPNVLIVDINPSDAGQEVYIRLWDSLDLIVNQPGIATAQISAHELPENPEDWQLCDFKESTAGASDGEGQRKANEFIVQYEEGATEQEKADIRAENGIGASDFRTCECTTQNIEVWTTANPIETETKRQRVADSSNGRQDTTGYNYVISLPTSLDTLEELQANTFVTNTQDLPAMSMDETGNFAVVWSSLGQDGDQRGIYCQRYDFYGVRQGTEIAVNTYTTDNQNRADIAMAAAGQFTVVWESDGQDGDRNGVYAQRFSKNGIKLGSEFRVNTYTTNNQNRPAIAMNDAGQFVVIWRSNQQDDPTGFGVFGQLYSPTGVAIGSEFQVNTYVTFSQENPDVAMSSEGDFVVVWQSLAQDGDNYGIYGQRYDKNGTPQGTEFRINTYTTARQVRPAVAMDEVGNFVVTWESEGQDGDLAGIYAQRYDRFGTTLGSEFRVNTFTVGAQSLPKVGMDEDGRFLIAWKSGGQDGSGTGIYAQRFDIDGTSVGTEFLVNTETMNDQDRPDIAMDADRDMVVSWASFGQDGSGKGVYLQQYFNTFYREPIQTTASSTEGTGPAQSYGNSTYIPNGSTIGNVIIATIDSGIDSLHPKFENVLWNYDNSSNCTLNTVGSIGIDLINNDSDPDDLDEHGTAVNGVLVDQFPNDIQLDVMNIKFFENDVSTLFDAICGIYYAVDQGADIVNLSWGFESSEFPTLLKDALDYAQCNDVLIVTSAGNTGKNNNNISKYPANLAEENSNIITVGAYETDYFGQNPILSEYSNFGDKVDLAAIGFVETTTSDSTFSVLAGTSLAAPAVARVAAMIKAYYPSLNAIQIKDCIISSVDNIGIDVRSGGILNEAAALACAEQKIASPCVSSNISINANVEEESCQGNDGLINLIVSNSEQNLNFEWSNGAMSEDLINLSAGTYTVTATDDCGCGQILEIEVQDECTGGNCQTDRNINDAPLIGSIYRASNSITSQAVVAPSINATFQAGQQITLAVGFHAQNGSNFTATIESCTPNTALPLEDRTTTIHQATSLHLYPNPASESINMQYQIPTEGKVAIGLYDANGRLIKNITNGNTSSKEWQQIEIPLHELNSGIYWIQLRTKDQILVEKLVVAR